MKTRKPPMDRESVWITPDGFAERIRDMSSANLIAALSQIVTLGLYRQYDVVATSPISKGAVLSEAQKNFCNAHGRIYYDDLPRWYAGMCRELKRRMA